MKQLLLSALILLLLWSCREEHSLGMLPLEWAPAGGRIAIIGAGAGRQVQYARKSGRDFEQILAIEIEPAVIDAVRGSQADRFDHVYEDSRVRVARLYHDIYPYTVEFDYEILFDGVGRH